MFLRISVDYAHCLPNADRAEHTLTRRGTFSSMSWDDAMSGTREKLDSIASARELVPIACSNAFAWQCDTCFSMPGTLRIFLSTSGGRGGPEGDTS